MSESRDNMSKILITGSGGTIGSAAVEKLRQTHNVVGLDLPENDVMDYDVLLEQARGMDTIIHLAHATGAARESWRSGSIDPRNVRMESNVFRAAAEAGVSRLIMASSVHADDFLHHSGEHLTVPGSMHPTSPYGAHKIITEERGRSFAEQRNIDFVGIRFGGVTRDDMPKPDQVKPAAVWLSRRDAAEAICACVDARRVPGKFAVFYAVSESASRIHSVDNPFGWQPLDKLEDRV